MNKLSFLFFLCISVYAEDFIPVKGDTFIKNLVNFENNQDIKFYICHKSDEANIFAYLESEDEFLSKFKCLHFAKDPTCIFNLNHIFKKLNDDYLKETNSKKEKIFLDQFREGLLTTFPLELKNKKKWKKFVLSFREWLVEYNSCEIIGKRSLKRFIR